MAISIDWILEPLPNLLKSDYQSYRNFTDKPLLEPDQAAKQPSF